MRFTLLCQELNDNDVTNKTWRFCGVPWGRGTNNAAHDAVQVGSPAILKTVRKQLHAPQPGSLSWLI